MTQTLLRPFDFDERLKEIDMFFAGIDRVHQTMHRVADRLEQAGIAYAIVGGMAVNAHRHERTTKDVDFLLTHAGLEAFRQKFIGTDFETVPGRPRRFRDSINGVTFDVLLTGLFPGNGKPGPIAYPDPADVRETIKDRQVVNLVTLVQLKLAARRHKDFGDVVDLIRENNLDESFRENLHSSVQQDYIECLEEKRREDEYEARQDESFEKLREQAEKPSRDED